MKKVRCRIAWGALTKTREEWERDPEYVLRTVIVVNSVFAIRKVPGITSARFFLTHRPTGFSSGRFHTVKAATAAAKALTKAFGVTAWRFTNPDDVKPIAKRARQIIRERGAL